MNECWRCALILPALVFVVSACGGDAPSPPTAAQQTYGAAVDATAALPAPTVAAEPDRYVGRRITVDGHIEAVAADGCALHLTSYSRRLRVEAVRPDAEACAWQVPPGTDGFAVAAGTLRTTGDTLRFSAAGVQVTPLHPSDPDS